jgi:tRNA G18 (ribose-2'-O)-methylase SpoU
MLHLHSIESLDLPELAPYRTMRWQADHRKQGIFVVEGEKVVRRLMESPLPVISLLLEDRWLPSFEAIVKARPEEIHVYVAPKKVLQELTGFPLFQGVLGVGRIPATVSMDRVIAESRRPLFLVAVEGVTNAQNMGAVVRNSGAFGVQALLVGETACSPYLRRAVRNSMGTIFQLPVMETQNLVRSLQELRSRGIRCIAAHPHAEGKTLSHCDFKTDCCVVFGSEGYGISEEVLKVCDEWVAIPMAATVDSLNVGSAVAVFLYEASRQRDRDHS